MGGYVSTRSEEFVADTAKSPATALHYGGHGQSEKVAKALCTAVDKLHVGIIHLLCDVCVSLNSEAVWPFLARVPGNSELKSETGSCGYRRLSERDGSGESERKKEREPYRHAALAIPKCDHGEYLFF